MRVALVCPYDIGRFGGVQNQVTLIAEALRRRGHEAWVVAPGVSDQPMESLGASRVWSANDSSTPIKLSPTLLPRLRRAVAAADIVHVHEPLMPLVGIAAVWTGKPLVGTFHADPSNRVRSLYRRFTPLRWHMRRYRALAAVSETALSALGMFGEIAVIPNGVATEGLPPRSPVAGRIVFVGRDDPRKGLDIAVAAVRTVRARYGHAELVVVTPDDVAPEPGVTVMVGIDDVAKLEMLSTAEVFIAPNRRGESFGLTVGEGMAAGSACVVSDIPAFAAVVGDAALRVTPVEPDAFAKAIESLFADPALAAGLGELAVKRAAQLSIERTVDAYVRMYDEVLGRED